MKKAVVKISIALLLAALCVFVFTGSTCLSDPEPLPYERREVGDFIVRFYDDYCEIEGTTEQGNSQRFLVIPEYIEGMKVKCLGYASIISNLSPAIIHSEMLEKVYFESAIEISNSAFAQCDNLDKIMYPELDAYSFVVLVKLGSDVYFPRIRYETGYMNSINTASANVSYYYNYKNENGDEYYWIDDCNYGSTIEFIPPAPEREGYVFGGWYKEPECINEWDFETDTLPEEKIEINENGEEEVVYQETILYAKWEPDPKGGE